MKSKEKKYWKTFTTIIIVTTLVVILNNYIDGFFPQSDFWVIIIGLGGLLLNYLIYQYK